MSTILVVDDDDSFASALCKTLKRGGFTVVWLDDGAEVSDTLPKVKADAVLLDLNMPGMNGWEVMRALRSRSHTSQASGEMQPKIVVLTGRHDPETAAFASRLGADAFLMKPLAGSQIVQTLREVLAK